jgi:4-hydroxybenzoate polyprenyltransferase
MVAMRDDVIEHRERVGFGELWRWAAPWVLGALLVLAALLGFFAASRAPDNGDYVMGLVTAGLALLVLAWRIKRAADGAASLATLPVLVDEASALVVLVGLLTALAIAGLLFAAHSGDGTVASMGYALFGFSLLFAFWNLKHYFDGRDRGGGG